MAVDLERKGVWREQIANSLLYSCFKECALSNIDSFRSFINVVIDASTWHKFDCVAACSNTNHDGTALGNVASNYNTVKKNGGSSSGTDSAMVAEPRSFTLSKNEHQCILLCVHRVVAELDCARIENEMLYKKSSVNSVNANKLGKQGWLS